MVGLGRLQRSEGRRRGRSFVAAALAILAVGAHQPTYAALLGVASVAGFVLALVNAEAERVRGRDG